MSENDKRGLAGWLGLRAPFDYSKARWLGPVLSGLVFLLFILAIASAVRMLGGAVFGGASLTPGNSLGVGAVTVALIGAPFVIWRSVVAQKSVDVHEQGHITDRINKAVEGLGAEKTVRRDDKEWTEPNLEVRIGAIYALERIAQDSDRDHVQIMEILCAYIRQNAPASKAMDWPELEMKEGEEDGPLLEDWEERWKAFRNAQKERQRTLKVREDIQVALTVIGRRSARQRRLEAGRGEEAKFPFDVPCPAYDGAEDNHDPATLGAYRKRLEDWKKPLIAYDGYRLDLRNASLPGADVSGLNLKGAKLNGTHLCGADLRTARFQGAVLEGARLQGAVLWGSQLQGANLIRARLQGADFMTARLQEAVLIEAQLQGASLWEARLQGADLGRASLQGASLWEAQLQGANLGQARLQGADLREARLQGANLRHLNAQYAKLSRVDMQGCVFSGAKLQGANLLGAQMQRSIAIGVQMQNANLEQTQLHNARLGGAQMQKATLNGTKFNQDTAFSPGSLEQAKLRNLDCTQLTNISTYVLATFGDGSVVLPECAIRPGHWPTCKLKTNDFEEEYRKWQADPEAYVPPEAREEA
ncbi:Uncharacterized protein YjbI, contains pentapeptide repeats [Roseovarius tolerans]|uniref:Uncharacterized protein YjbI, contains pentapeptide repeats n=1 Tax=Roseovarius tolerans TaxID=74031 RepID=A0A1H8BHD3_9RHOB|nr:pentapeptide repeat-containing protein [Roseovarius tolerans]SEM81534.1 Uncharacterized protein YjbI, contains pentapeptide repeats [Roseovarius tolerans]